MYDDPACSCMIDALKPRFTHLCCEGRARGALQVDAIVWQGPAEGRAAMQRIGSTQVVTPEQRGPLQRFFQDLGPGLISGAADDDPSGISTYSVAGAAYGYSGLWTALFSFPLMAAVQLMCARLGMVTGRGLAAVIRTRHPPPVLWFACTLVIVANVFNI